MESILYINFTQVITNLCPVFCDNGSNEVNIMEPMFRGLYKFGETGVEPDLVQLEHVEEDLRVWTLKLKLASWSNGQPVTAQDFQQTWLFVLKNNLPNSHMLFHIEGAQDVYEHRSDHLSGLEILDNQTIRITLAHPTPYFRETACHIAYKPAYFGRDMVPFTKQEFEKGEELIVNGDYHLSSWSNQEIILQSNVSDVEFEKISFTFDTDYYSIVDRLSDGRLDVHDGGSIGDIEVSKKMDQYLELHPFLSTFYLIVNLNESKLQNPALRRLLAASIDREHFSGKEDKVPTAYLIPDDLASWSRDYSEFEIPKELTFEGVKLRLICNDEQVHIRTCKIVQESWRRQLGLEVELIILPWDEFMEKLDSGDFDIARGGWVADFSDPLAFFEIFASNSSLNFPKWKSDEFDRLLLKARQVAIGAERQEIYRCLEAHVIEEAPILPIYYQLLRQTVGPNIAGYKLSPTGTICFHLIKRAGNCVI